MSVIITRTPNEFQPGLSDDLYFILSGSNVNEPKFRYTYNVVVNDYVVFEGKCTPNQYGKGIVDVSRILDTYLQNYPISYHNETPIFTHQTSPFSRPYTNDVIDYYIEVGEEYASSLTGTITGFTGNGEVGQPQVQSETLKTFLGTMGVNRKANEASFDIGQFTLSGSPSPDFPYTENCLFLTNSPRIMDISNQEYYTLSFTNYELGGDYLSEPYFVKLTFFDSSDAVITAYTYANITENGGGPLSDCAEDYYVNTFTGEGRNYNILNIGVGPKNIYNFPSNTSYYQVQLYGKAIPPTPTPTPSNTPTPTPSGTPNASPTPTPTPSSTPDPCYEYQISNANETPIDQTYIDCNGLETTITIENLDSISVCLRSYTTVPGVFYFNIGACQTITPTPTPSMYSTPTPSPVYPVPAFVRSCCDGVTELQVFIDSALSVGDTIMIEEECYEIYALGGEGFDGDYSFAPAYNNCAECKSQYPCPEGDKPSVDTPNVEPDPFVPSGGSEPCVFGYAPVSETFQFNVKEDCNYFLNRQLMFKNRYGQWDYFLFEKYRSEGLGISRETYGKTNTTWGSNNPQKVSYSRGKTDFNTSINETHILNSGFLNDPEFVWLEDLFTSNDVYIIEPDGRLFAINIEDTEFVRKTKGNRSLTNIQLTISYSNNIKLLNN